MIYKLSRVFPTSCVVYGAGKPIERVVYLCNISTSYHFTIDQVLTYYWGMQQNIDLVLTDYLYTLNIGKLLAKYQQSVVKESVQYQWSIGEL